MTFDEAEEMIEKHGINPAAYFSQLPGDQEEFLGWDVLCWLGY